MSRRLATTLVLTLLAAFLPTGPRIALAAPPETVSVRIRGLEVQPTGRTQRHTFGSGVARTGAEVRSVPVAADIPFAMIGLALPPDVGHARVRTSPDGITWGPWLEAERLPDDEGPDPDSAEARRPLASYTEPLWVGPSRQFQVATTGTAPSAVEVVAIDPAGLTPGTRRTTVRTTFVDPAAEAAEIGRLGYVSRAEWGADESKRNGGPRYADTVRHAVVHHTAGTNDYGPEDGPAIVRGIYHYHTQTLGWDDIGYNALVDRFGTVYEGRAGGLDRPVIGAHAAGYNAGSFGISVMGSFMGAPPPAAAMSSLSDVLAWKLRLHGVDPYDRVRVGSGSGARTVDAVAGHRDVGSTSCPGDALYARLPDVRGRTAQKMGGFSDVAGSVHATAIERIARARVARGCGGGAFCPNAVVTRGQMATFLTRTFELAPGPDPRFSDVPPGNAHAGAIAAAVAAGVASGYPDRTFRPHSPVSREQMAAMLQRALDLAPEEGVRFSDTVGSLYRSSINALSTAAITGGCTDSLYCPVDAVSRGQMASFLDRTLTLLGR